MLIPLTTQADLLITRLAAASAREHPDDRGAAHDAIRSLAPMVGFYIIDGAPYGLEPHGFYHWLASEGTHEDVLLVLAA